MDSSNKRVNLLNILVLTALTVAVSFFTLFVLSNNQDKKAVSIDNLNKNEVMGTQVQDVEELNVEVITEGDGAIVEAGDLISVHYTGTLLDGTKFDSSKDRGVPFEFVIGEGYVIQGWDMGLEGQKVGSTVILTIPSSMGYGSRGSGAIPANAGLKFEVEILEVK